MSATTAYHPLHVTVAPYLFQWVTVPFLAHQDNALFLLEKVDMLPSHGVTLPISGEEESPCPPAYYYTIASASLATIM